MIAKMILQMSLTELEAVYRLGRYRGDDGLPPSERHVNGCSKCSKERIV